ncbi:hypothetical protein [Paenibacillus sonchi]|nr:hypothetical protein [Paenibacillus sonchi]
MDGGKEVNKERIKKGKVQVKVQVKERRGRGKDARKGLSARVAGR